MAASPTDAQPPVPDTEAEDAAAGAGGKWRFARAGISLTAANITFAAFGFITGPLLARALGPDGRGDLAAILVPLTVIAFVAVFGQDIYAARQAARGKSVGTLVLSIGCVLVAIGVLVAVLGIPISNALAEDREEVKTFLLIGFAVMPISLLTLLLIGVANGLERWNYFIAARLLPAALIVIWITVLYVADELTVETAAVGYLVTGTGTILLLLPLLRRTRLRFDRGMVKEGLSYGARAWVGTTADIANGRLDQLLMVTLVSPRELGLYVVAATVGSMSTFIGSGVATPLLARTSAGERAVAPRALRLTLGVLLVLTALAALVTPALITVLFGSDFNDAIVPAWILLAAGIPLAGNAILTEALNGAGRPGLPAIAQGIALAITVPALVLLLPVWGIVGAAVISLVAYTASFVFLLASTMRTYGVTATELLVPTGEDLAWLRDLVGSRLRRRAAPGDD